MNTIYVIENPNINDFIMEEDFIEKTDKVICIINKEYLFREFNKKINSSNIFIHKVNNISDDALEFELVPILKEICRKNEFEKCVLVSKNKRFRCLIDY